LRSEALAERYPGNFRHGERGVIVRRQTSGASIGFSRPRIGRRVTHVNAKSWRVPSIVLSSSAVDRALSDDTLTGGIDDASMASVQAYERYGADVL
jgi:hypothetical protein